VSGAEIAEVRQELVVALARDVVTTQAPEELPLFRATSRAYLDTPEAVLKRTVGRDETLGFGAETFAAITPFVLAVSSVVVNFLAAQLTAVAQEAATEEARGLLRGWLARIREKRDGAVPPLTADQLARVRDLAFAKARQLELPEDKSSLLADAMVGSLASAG
jgi:hypothetical protein